MNPRRIYGAFICERKENIEDLSLRDLEERVCELTDKQNYIRDCGLSCEVTSLAIRELDEQKAEIRRVMHKLVDML